MRVSRNAFLQSNRMMAKKKPVGSEPMCSEQQVKLIDPIWAPGRVPRNYWTERSHRRAYLLWLGWKLGFRKAKDWYRLTNRLMRANSGNGLEHRYRSAHRAMIDCFPEYEWHEWLFRHLPAHFWDVPANRRRYFRWLGTQMGFRRAKDWYALQSDDLCRHGGQTLLKRYSSMYDLLREFLPQLDWEPFRKEPPLSVERILRLADAYYAEHGKWPTSSSGPAAGTNLTWSGINERLWGGHVGFRGGSSLAALLLEHRGVPLGKPLPPLTERQILAWADAYHAEHGRWPNRHSGAVPGARETWDMINNALQSGYRGLEGGSSLARLLEHDRGVRNRGNLQRLSEQQIIAWARIHQAATGRWPSRESGDIPNTRGETWSRVEDALVKGHRGLPGGSSVAKLLRAHGLK